MKSIGLESKARNAARKQVEVNKLIKKAHRF